MATFPLFRKNFLCKQQTEGLALQSALKPFSEKELAFQPVSSDDMDLHPHVTRTNRLID